MKFSIFITVIALYLFSSLSLAEECKINGHAESEFKPAPKEIRDFIEKETHGLFYRASSSHWDYMKSFNLVQRMPGDKNGHWGDDKGRNGYANGTWLDSYIYERGGKYVGYNNTNSLFGPVYLGDGLASIDTYSNSKHPYEIEIFQLLDNKYYTSDVVRAIKDKFGLSNAKSCVYDGWLSVAGSGGSCNSGSPMLFVDGEKYYHFQIWGHALNDHDVGVDSLTTTLLRYRVSVYKLNEYNDCLATKSKGEKLKL